MLPYPALREAALFLQNELENITATEGAVGALPRSLGQLWGATVERRLADLTRDVRAITDRGYLYIIPTEVDGVWKIGKTDNLKRRLGGYQTGRATPVNFVHTRTTLDQHLAEKILKDLLKERAYVVPSLTVSGTPVKDDKQRARELFQMELPLLKDLLEECCLNASTLVLFRLNQILRDPSRMGGGPTVPPEKMTALMAVVDRFVGAVIHSAKMPSAGADPRGTMTWYKPGEAVDLALPLVDLLQRTNEVLPEDTPIVQALLFDRLVASRTTCVVGESGPQDQVLVRLRSPEDVRARMGQVVIDFELAMPPEVRVPVPRTEASTKNENGPQPKAHGGRTSLAEKVVLSTAATGRAQSPAVPPRPARSSNAAAAASTTGQTAQSEAPAPPPRSPAVGEEAAPGTEAEGRARRNSTDQQTKEIQKFVDWIQSTKPEWAQTGKTVTMKELHEHYRKVPGLEPLGERIVFKKTRELLKCEKVSVYRGEQTLVSLKMP